MDQLARVRPDAERTGGIWTFLGLCFAATELEPGSGVDAPTSRLLDLVASGDEQTICILTDPGPPQRILLGFRSPDKALDLLVRFFAASSDPTLPGVGLSIGSGLSGVSLYECPAARRSLSLAGLAPSGQALIANSAFEVMRDSAPSDYGFADLGTIFVDSHSRRDRVFQLLHEQINHARIHLLGEERPPSVLPPQFGFLVGRTEELDDVLGRIARLQLVTIVGSGGIGKSHLARRAAAELVEANDFEVIWVDMTALETPNHIIEAIADALTVDRIAPASLEECIYRQLSNRKCVLVLDGCDRARSTIAGFLEKAVRIPGPRFLATSMVRLGVRGESVLQLQPLEVPTKDFSITAENIEQFESSALFLDRTREVRPEFSPSESEAEAIATICRRLSGHPLGLVLAAKRMRRSSPEQIVYELGEIIGASQTGKQARADARHRSAALSLEWTFQSLSDRAQELAKKMFPIRGAWNRVDIAALADLETEDVEDPLQELVDSGLVTIEPFYAGVTHYRIAPTIAHIIQTRLVKAEARQETLERHCLLMIGKLATVSQKISGSDEGIYLDQIEALRADLAAAFEQTIRAHPKTFVDALAMSWMYWYKRSRASEVLNLVDRAARKLSDAPELYLGRLLNTAGALAEKSGLNERAIGYLKRAYRIGKHLHHDLLCAASLTNLGNCLVADAEYEQAIVQYGRAQVHFAKLEMKKFEAAMLLSWSGALLYLGRMEESEVRFRQAEIGFGDSQDHLSRWTIALGRGLIALKRGNYEVATTKLVEAIRISREMGDLSSMARGTAWLTDLAICEGRYEMGARCMGLAEHLGKLSGAQLFRTHELRFARNEGLLRGALGSRQFEALKAAGALLSLEEVLDLVQMV